MPIETVTDQVRAKLAENPPFGHTLLFDFGSEGAIHIDGTQTPAIVSNERGEAETTLSLSVELFQKMLRGEGGAMLAYATGALKVSGSLGVAMKLNSMLED
jgi:putative sterol carrier protein